MKQTAVEKMIQYFIEQKDNGASHWCINDLIAQLYQAKEMEKEQSHLYAEFAIRCDRKDMKILNFEDWIKLETFKSENIVMFMTPENGEIESIILTDNPDCGVKGITFKSE